jgi:uncharacterized membrane protein YphA (DoxX/SURF4 family)
VQQFFLVGRIIVGAYYLFNAFEHFTRLSAISGYAASRHVPAPQVAVIISGILLAIAGLSLLLGIYPKLGIAALVLFYIPVSVMMHPFWADADPALRLADLVNFTKNFALLGSSLMFLVIPEPWPYSLHVPSPRAARAHV